MTYVFYDTETTGIQTGFDQVLQFAAIKTDNELNELDTFDIRCKLLPYVIPAPQALLTTRVTPDMLLDASLCTHYEAVRKIRAKMSEWSPATFVGYNSIAFDEELLRQSFFKTLHGAYLTNTGGNSRSDVMRVAHAASIYAPGSINVPTDGKKESFRLDKIAPANGYAHNQAHEALADVRATIHVAKLLKGSAPEVWTAMDTFSRKAKVIEHLDSAPMFSWSERMFGKSHSWMVVPCGQNAKNSGQVVVFDLAYDPDVFANKSVGELVEVMNSKHKAIRTIRANAQPIIMPAGTAPDGTAALQLSEKERDRRADALAKNKELREKICMAAEQRFAVQEAKPHIEQRIYDGFANADEPLMENFHTLDWDQRSTSLGGFKDARVTEFAHRLVYAEKPECMDKATHEKMKKWHSERIYTKDDVPWTTVQKALDETEKLMSEASSEEISALSEIKKFLNDYPNRVPV